MNNFITILKYNLINNLGLNKLTKKNRNKAAVGIGTGAILVYLLILAFATFYMFVFVEIFYDVGNPKMIFLVGITLSSLLTFFSTLPKANAYLFRSKDYDLLMALPVKTNEIVSGKLLSLYLVNLLFCFTIMFSIEIAYSLVCGFDAMIMILFFILIFFTPMFPIAIGSLLSFLLGFIPMKQKIKNIVSTIFYLIFTIGFLLVYFSVINADVKNVNQQMSKIYSFLSSAYFLGNWGYNGINGNILQLFLFILISIISILIFTIVVGYKFKSFNSIKNRSETNKNFKLSKENYTSSKSEIQSLFSKEMKTYLGLPMYIMNTIIGPILSVIGTILICMNMSNVVQVVLSVSDEVLSRNISMIIITMMLVFCLSLVSTTASSISIEGKSFWIIKSAPIKTTSVFWSKILLNLLITIPFIIIDTIIAAVIIKPDIIYVILCVVIPSIFAFSMSFIGLFFNTLFPKFDFDNPIKVIKQGVSVLLTMLVGMFFAMISFVFGMVLLIAFTNCLVSVIILLVAGLLFLVLSSILTFKVGIRKYERIAG